MGGGGGGLGKNYNTMTVIKLSSLTVIKLFQFIYVIHTMWFDSSDFDLSITLQILSSFLLLLFYFSVGFPVALYP